MNVKLARPEKVARREQVDLVINSLLEYAAKFKLRLMLNECCLKLEFELQLQYKGTCVEPELEFSSRLKEY